LTLFPKLPGTVLSASGYCGHYTSYKMNGTTRFVTRAYAAYSG
jgi:hypothetical protein